VPSAPSGRAMRRAPVLGAREPGPRRHRRWRGGRPGRGGTASRARRHRPCLQPLPADSEIARTGRAHGRPSASARCWPRRSPPPSWWRDDGRGRRPDGGCSTHRSGLRPRFRRGQGAERSSGGTARPAPGWRCIELDPRDRLLRAPAGMVLDLGATAKAFAADRAAARIAEVTGWPYWSTSEATSASPARPRWLARRHSARLRHVTFHHRCGCGTTSGWPRQFGDIGADMATGRPPVAPHR